MIKAATYIAGSVACFQLGMWQAIMDKQPIFILAIILVLITTLASGVEAEKDKE